jgi:hypothetical protein
MLKGFVSLGTNAPGRRYDLYPCQRGRFSTLGGDNPQGFFSPFFWKREIMLVILLLVLLVAPLIVLLYRLTEAIWESKTFLREKLAKLLGEGNSQPGTSRSCASEDSSRSETQKAPDSHHSGFEIRCIPLRNATIGLRRYPSKGIVNGVLYLFGKPKKGVAPVHDLGFVETKTCSSEVLSHFAKIGKERLELLEALGKRQRCSTKVEKKQVIPELPPVPQIQVSQPEEWRESNAVELVTEMSQIRVAQAIYRGEILMIGLLPKVWDNGSAMVHGVKLRTEDGREQYCYGSHLKQATRIARARIGDFVEITRVGRKIITEGKAPMNIWEVRKLSSISA